MCVYIHIYVYMCIISLSLYIYIYICRDPGRIVPQIGLLPDRTACRQGSGPERVHIVYFTVQKLTLTPREKNFQSANVRGSGDFGSQFQ